MSMRASAARYARALFDVTSTESDPGTAEHDLSAFVALVKEHPDLQRTFANPVVSAQTKQKVVRAILDRSQPSPPVGKLLLLLASRGRLELVDDVLAVFRERLMEHQQIVQAEVTTAEALSAERVDQLQRRLSAITGRTVRMTTKVDPGIIGGAVTRIGSTVYDGSVATQLAKVRERLGERG